MRRVTLLGCVIATLTLFSFVTPPCLAAQESADIWKAAANGDIATIKQYLQAGVDVNAKEHPGGSQPLLVAAAFGRLEAARLLIENGANVNAKSNDGATALHGAAFFCHTEMVELLVAKGAEVNAKNNKGETPLDAVAGQWSSELEGIYKFLAGLWSLQLDLDQIKSARPQMAILLANHGGKSGSQVVKGTGYRG